MASVKISALPAAAALAAADIFPVVQGGVTSKATMTQLAALMAGLTTVKPANTDRNNIIALTADPDLAFAAVPAGTYVLEAYIGYQSNATALYKGSVKCSQNLFTSWLTTIAVERAQTLVNQGSMENPVNGSTGTAYPVNVTNESSILIKGVLILPSATDISWQWAQSVQTVVATLTLAGSWMSLRKIA